ncbi:MAG: hypothetical protein LKI25_06315 [Atopobiaceae bacterium]|jgi:hypothetical protein|nr:hypothetical protein [Atopobiaceae bacterium]MCI2173812.1 hypothetical protein [Atopobiaceae bacterium]MCI2207546.1 hypothetical protein [Atopobiaceae bacterium]
MTILNVLSFLLLAGVVVACVLVVRHVRSQVDAADGLGEVNDLGEDASTDDGTYVGRMGDGDADDMPPADV